jgi:drug/metabolite transporter (DMT)-like permease
MIGLIFIVLAQVAYAFGGLLMRKYLASYNPVLVSSLMAVTSIIFFIPIILFFFRLEVGGLTFRSSLPFIAAGIIWLVIAEMLYITGFQKAPSLVLASLMTLFYPLFSAVLGIYFLNEPLTIKTFIAAALMVAGFVFLVI